MWAAWIVRVSRRVGGRRYWSTLAGGDEVRRLQGHQVDSRTYVKLLQRCMELRDVALGGQVRDHIVRSGRQLNVYELNTLIKLYSLCGDLGAARRVFDGVVDKTVVSWNAMIGGYAHLGHVEQSVSLFRQMCNEGLEPNTITYMTLLDACSCRLEWGREVHAHAVNAGFVSLGTALVTMYVKGGSMEEARRVFDALVEPDVSAFNVMIGGYAKSGDPSKALQLFHAMQQEVAVPNRVTYMHVVNACARDSGLKFGREVHSQVERLGFGGDLLVSTALVHMYAKCGAVDEARQVFDSMPRRDVVAWSAMIGGYAQNGYGGQAFEVFCEMKREGVEPDEVTYINLLNICVNPGVLHLGKEIHSQVMKAGLGFHIPLMNALINMYSKSGSIDDARQVFDSMVERDVITWNAMLGGYGQHGHAAEALDLFERMLEEQAKPNAVTFVGVLSACSRAGFVTEGRQFFTSLVRDHGIVPTMEIYGCMVDLLGRAGHLDEAEQLINSMPLPATSSIWSSLLGACRIHGNLDMAERAAERSLRIDPQDGAVYVQLSHMYAAAGKWDNVAKVRKVMEGRGVKKEQGCTWIKIDGKVHSFVTEDRSHPQVRGIYSELARLMREIKREGYVPLTQTVLHDVGEQQKEEAISYHSEKLAIAYGIISTPACSPIHIYKNLRVCADCHSASKFISKLTGREIIARDASRFHHFKDGLCSCGDYW